MRVVDQKFDSGLCIFVPYILWINFIVVLTVLLYGICSRNVKGDEW